MSREELAVLLDARNKLCGFCEYDVCEMSSYFID